MKKQLAALLLSALLLLTGCGAKNEPAAQPTATPAQNTEPTSAPTATPKASSTAAPTATPMPKPTAGATPRASATPKASASPTPRPTATAAPRPTAAPSAKPTVTQAPEKPFVSKHPVSVTVNEGGSCTFEAGYINAIWAVWHFVSPDGKTDLAYDQIGTRFPNMQVLNGMYSKMELRNIPAAANGWRVYCRYTNSAGSSDSDRAVLTVSGTAPTAAPGRIEVSGTFADSIAGRGTIEITGTPALYTVSVRWPNSAFAFSSWSFAGVFDANGVMRYTNAVKTVATFDDNGMESIDTVYTNGAGTLTYFPSSDTLFWDDGHGTDGTFVRAVAPIPSVTPAVNEWTETEDLDAAIADSGVEFAPPIPEALPNGLALDGFRSRLGVIEARYGGGTLIVRKSNTTGGSELSGDHNNYSKTWDISLKGLAVHCRGNGATVNEATFAAGANSYSISFHPGQEGAGLTPDQINALVNGMQ